MPNQSTAAVSWLAALWVATLVFAHPPNQPHPTSVDPSRFFTDREAATLAVPAEEDAFSFVIFGDRTGGVAAGVQVLKQAVRDTNLLEPDLVMTVGDLIQGYNTTQPWLEEMREYKEVMDRLLCPWFPVAGNHDVYWRGPNRPADEHESNYEMHFGPLWYAFTHKDCWFIVLYSDEGDPDRGLRAYSNPDCQRMSPEQKAWLSKTLDRAAEARHVFVFIHHPRWMGGGYGDDWENVHPMLAKHGNVRAVFAGHVHRMRHDGVRDGIEYVTLATTGGAQSFAVPEAGYLNHFHVVTVRPNQIAMAALPVGEVLDVRSITGTISDETRQLASLRPTAQTPLKLGRSGQCRGLMTVTLANPVTRPIDITLLLKSADPHWSYRPDHRHAMIEAGDSVEFVFEVDRDAAAIDSTFRFLEMETRIDYLAPQFRYTIPPVTQQVALDLDLPVPQQPAVQQVLATDGQSKCLRVATDTLHVPDGPLTLECWFKARSYGDRVGLVAKTEGSEFGIFVSNASPSFDIFLGDRYAHVEPDEAILKIDRWHHIAGVYDGAESRLYVDGQLIARNTRGGARRLNSHPLLVGADVDSVGRPVSHFDGWIDEVRLSTTARYQGDRFEPQRRFESDGQTSLLLHMDGMSGPWVYDHSPYAAHAVVVGGAELVGESAGR